MNVSQIPVNMAVRVMIELMPTYVYVQEDIVGTTAKMVSA